MSATYSVRMKNPAHPGGFVKDEIVEAQGITVTRAARALGVTRPALSALLAHLYHALNKHSYFQWVTTFERCVWHYRRLLGDYTMVFWMPPGSGSTLKAS